MTVASVIGWLKAHGRRNAGRLLVVCQWVAAFALARYYDQMLFGAALLVINLEILKRSAVDDTFFECVNSALLHILVFVLLRHFLTFDLRWGLFSGDIAYLVEAVVALLLNRRYGFVSLDVLARFLLIASVVGFVFHLWQKAFVPHGRVNGYSLALDLYYRWAVPVEMALVASPFLFIALRADLRNIRTGALVPKSADVYYGYGIPIISFGLFPGVGRSFQANCGMLSTHVAIGAILVLVVAGLLLSLAVNRRSIVIAAAFSSLLLGTISCVEAPVTSIVTVLAITMVLFWRWLPKGRDWPGVPVAAA